jgi:hypothetical protein
MNTATLIAVTQPEQDLSVESAWQIIIGLCPSLEELNDSK